MAKKIWLVTRLEQLNNGKLIEFLQECLNEEEKFITQLNKTQLEKGIKADNKLMPDYSPRTINQRQIDGNPVKGKLIALYDTGEFWNAFWSEARDKKLIMGSDDWKTESLIAKYGETIFGLTDDSFKILGEKIMPNLRTKIIKFLTA
jgi:hypothetical protein